MIKIVWNDAKNPPDVPKGSMGYFMVVTEKSKTSFGAYYLNGYCLRFEDGCPDATEEDGASPCQSCENGDGHPRFGWHQEKANRFDEDFYFQMAVDGPYSVKLWAHMPKNPLLALLPAPPEDT